MGERINLFSVFVSVLLLVVLSSCETDQANTDTPAEKPSSSTSVNVPKFQRDSAYTFVKRQVDFGPRVPNSAGHQATKKWLVQRFKSFGAKVIEQDFQAEAYTGTILNATNIIASYYPERKKRIFLCAHWDTRHIADKDANEEKQNDPILGADDGGSGVGVILELARQLQQQPLENIGIDFVLFDAEDHGEPAGGATSTWCLGSQHWSRNPHVPSYKAEYGVLLDMVGSKDAQFPQEGNSRRYAPQVVKKVWGLAKKLGYGNYFVERQVPEITDDHLFVNTIARIPTIDIINLPPGSSTGFGHYWHTHKDDMDVIDKRTLRTVGQLMLNVIYREDAGKL